MERPSWILPLVFALSAAASGSPAGGQAPPLDDLRVTTAGEIGPTELRVDLVILGDGFIEEDFRPGGRWETDAARLVKNFFEKLPFKSLRSLFNVFLVEVPSMDRGADSEPGSDTKRTALNCTFGAQGIDRLLVCQDEKAALQAARNAPAADILIILVNDNRLGGSGGAIGDLPAAVCSAQPTAFGTAIHEIGHSFAHLADEYVDEEIADKYPLPLSGDLPEPNVTLVRCVDRGSRDALIDSLKWGHFLDEPNSERLYGKGIWEGGYYRSSEVYRPAANCIMGNSAGQFCYVCIEEMTKAIHRKAGRGPAGGIFPKEIPRMKGRLRRACYFYGAGLFGRCISELAGLERREDFQAEEREKTAQVRVAIAESLRDEMTRVEDLVQKGDALGAEGHLGFLEISAKDTEWEAEVRAKRKAITPALEFKRELAAGREILRLEVLLKDKRRIAGQQDMARKLVDEFLKKHKGTRACQKAEELLARLARSRPKKPTAKE